MENIHKHIKDCLVKSGFDIEKIFTDIQPRDTGIKSIFLTRKRIDFNEEKKQYLTRSEDWNFYITLTASRLENISDLDYFICFLGKEQSYVNDCSEYNYNIVNVDYSNAYNTERFDNVICEIHITKY
jgi:hypothetical protein